jgi:predicted transposase YdaD
LSSGAKEKSKEIAKKMLKEKMSIEMIMKLTKLTKEEIQNLEKN